MMLLKCCTQYANKFGKLNSGYRTGKGQFSFQSQRRAMPKDVQAGFRKGRGTRDQIANICWTIEKAREFKKKSSSASLTTLKSLTVLITTNCGKFLKR